MQNNDNIVEEVKALAKEFTDTLNFGLCPLGNSAASCVLEPLRTAYTEYVHTRSPGCAFVHVDTDVGILRF